MKGALSGERAPFGYNLRRGIAMKTTKRYRTVAFIVALALLPAILPGFVTGAEPPLNQLPSRGLFVNTLNCRDFPFAPGMSGSELDSQIESIVYTAESGGYDAIFFEARPAGDSFYSSTIFPRSAFWLKKQNGLTLRDPLKDFIEAAGAKGIAVYAVVNPYYLGADSTDFSRKSPAVKYSGDCFTTGRLSYLKPESDRALSLNTDDAARLFDKYDIAGIVLHGVDRPELASRQDYAAHLESLVSSLSGMAANKGGFLGVVTEESPTKSAIDPGRTDAHFIIPRLTGAPGDDLSDAIAQWCTQADSGRIMPMLSSVSTYTPTVGGQLLTDKDTRVNQLYLAQEAGVARYCIDSLRMATTDPSVPRLPSAMIDLQSLLTDIKLDYDHNLNITRPAERISVTSGSYYIFGLSDPDSPLYMDGEEIERSTMTGTFGVLVNLQMGENRFVFTQQGKSQTAVINRYSPSGTSQTYSLSALQPTHFLLARQGQPFTLTCTGPAGADVTVMVSGYTIAMQPRTSAGAGTPVVYEATLKLPDSFYIPGETQSAGQVYYTLSYDNRVTEYASAGEIYGPASDTNAAVKVTSQNTSVYIAPSQDGVFTGQLKPGTLDYIADETHNYCELASGGYIKKECCEVLVGIPDVMRRIGVLSPINHDRDDLLFVSGAAGVPFLIEQDQEGLSVTLYNAVDFPVEVPTFSALFDGCVVTEDHGSITLRLPFAGEERPWGADVYYEEDDAIVAIRLKLNITNSKTQPLSGLTVMLDPGHGGTDPGALGVAGKLGPDESDLNLAISLVAQQRLEALGASVYLTNWGDEDVTLVERMAMAQDIRPDFFISIHHNSVAETTDASRAGGTECYYHFENSRELAKLLVKNVGEISGRYQRGAYESYYVVTKMSGFPSVLLELGFVSSPREYEKMADYYDIFRTTGAITDAIYELAAA